MEVEYFYSLTPRQFDNIHKGWTDKREADVKMQMIFTRRLMWAALAPHSKKGTTEQDLWPFDFEKDTLQTRSLEDEIEEARKLQESIEYWERIDALRKQKATC